jgi:hypothetical protein
MRWNHPRVATGCRTTGWAYGFGRPTPSAIEDVSYSALVTATRARHGGEGTV